MCVVEVGIKLDKPLSYYQSILDRAGAINIFNCETRDLYWTNKSLDGMSENEMKKACVRCRMTSGFGDKHLGVRHGLAGTFQNYKIFDSDRNDSFDCDGHSLLEYRNELEKNGWYQVFDTYKKDYQYMIVDMKSRIQLQDIKNVGLLLYYDNPDLYHLPEEEQRKALIDELNSYGFAFSYNQLDLDKLRTLWYKKECFSKNQNG